MAQLNRMNAIKVGKVAAAKARFGALPAHRLRAKPQRLLSNSRNRSCNNSSSLSNTYACWQGWTNARKTLSFELAVSKGTRSLAFLAFL